MTVKKILLLACVLLIPVSGWAGQQELTYTIKKGDTLWGISQRFLKDPGYWPDLWADNPFITNPHFIYPNQKISLYDGRIELVPVRAAKKASGAAAKAAPAAAKAIKPQQKTVIRIPSGQTGFITQHELDSAGTLVDATDSRILLAKGNTVFLQMKDLSSVRPGERFSLFEIGREVDEPATGKPLGHLVDAVGTVKVTAINSETATGILTENFREIERGAKLLPFVPPHLEVTLKKSKHPLSGHIIIANDDRIALGQYDVVYIDLGAEDGLQKGNMLYISRPRHASEQALQAHQVKLPDVLLGNAVVLQTRQKTASALILKSAGAIHVGDNVSTMTR